MVAEDAEYRRLDEEWKVWVDRISQGETPEDDFHYAVRWVLVSIFGHVERYQHDPAFHAQVHGAEAMIRALHEATERLDPG